MADTATVAVRRNNIAQRWLRGQSVSSIAQELEIPLGTCRHDLHFIRQALLAGQGEVLRACRAKTMAAVEDTISEAWQCVDALKAPPPAQRDWPALNASLTLILRAHTQLAKVAGLGAPPIHRVQVDVLDRDVFTWIDAQEAAKERAYQRALQYEDDDEDLDEEDEDDEQDVAEQVSAAYERGRADGQQQANEIAIAAVREMAEQLKAEAEAEATPEPTASIDEPEREDTEPVQAEPVPEPVPPPPPPPRRPRPPTRGFDPPDPVDDAEPVDWGGEWKRKEAKQPASISVFDQLVAEARAQNGGRT